MSTSPVSRCCSPYSLLLLLHFLLLQLELEAARLALCEEAVLRDLLRRCGIALPPGYARADAVNKLRGGGGGGGKRGGGPPPTHPSAAPPEAGGGGAAAAAAATTAGAAGAGATAAAPGSSGRKGSGSGGSRGPSRSRGGRGSRGSSRRGSVSGSSKQRGRGAKRRKSEGSMEVRGGLESDCCGGRGAFSCFGDIPCFAQDRDTVPPHVG